MCKITVFTPTYNRAGTIEKLYRSLQVQKCKDFEWLVIDDGSKDNTEELFKKWENEENNFNLRYIRKENGGKHTAINVGVREAKGKLFFIVDSDDYLMPDAIEKILAWEKGLPKGGNEKFAGVSGARGYSETQIIGTGHGKEYIDCTSQERIKYGMTGDKAEVFYTDVLKLFPFPVYEDERFVAESVVWFAIGNAGYKMRWYDDIIYIGEYREDGLTNQEMDLYHRNPKGYLLMIKSDLKSLNPSLVRRLAYYAVYDATARKIGKTRKQAADELGVSKASLAFANFLKNVRQKILRK